MRKSKIKIHSWATEAINSDLFSLMNFLEDESRRTGSGRTMRKKNVCDDKVQSFRGRSESHDDSK